MNLIALKLGVLCALSAVPSPAAQSLPAHLPEIRYHLTARPWQPLGVSAAEYLDRVEGIVRFTARQQRSDGAIIDPVAHREHQYATPYYAHALGTLLGAGRAKDLLPSGVRAMEWATRCFETNRTNGHRVFYITPLVESLELYAPHVPPATLAAWRGRLKTAVAVKEAYDNNWSTYLMKGQWLRAKAGLIGREAAIEAVEGRWKGGQRARIVDTPWNLYHDLTSVPDTLAVEAVGRGNLIALAAGDYDGPSAAEIVRAVEAGTRTSLLLQDPSGQMPCNGRTDDHVWGDVGYLLAFEVMAERAWPSDRRLAGQYRRAAMLVLRNIDRWRRQDGAWVGSYYVTKNHFDPALRVGYQSASEYSNYNGSLMHHLAQAYLVRRSEIPERPAPVEIGGYALELDAKFAAALANAGGMQMQMDLRADTSLSSGNQDYWSALGVVRLGRVGWDTRLGPSDGGRNGSTGLGASCAPTFEEDGRWVRLASVADRYEGRFSVQFAHPLLVRCAVDYSPRRGAGGPSFRQEFVITPDGVLSTLTRTAGKGRWGVTLPLLENDGAPLATAVGSPSGIASTHFPGRGDEQNFIVLEKDAALTAEAAVRSTYQRSEVGGQRSEVALTAEPVVRSTYGDLLPVRALADGATLTVFVYPRSPDDPSAERVRDSLRVTPSGFSSALGTVTGNLYVGRSAAGGVGGRIELKGNGRPDAAFSKPCGFILQLADGKATAVETDRDVHATIQGREIELHAYRPVTFDEHRAAGP